MSWYLGILSLLAVIFLFCVARFRLYRADDFLRGREKVCFHAPLPSRQWSGRPQGDHTFMAKEPE
ncbi:hypothetical protein N1030_14220 [Desulfovibrio mangrovi]|uniref:hypothetical protein n=1 Tax=Desulfovibrio mangrovi TaxID=2976983 RepID=UPI0022457487|nr:hypothetical protein [Desulfovibrio mangrovi]UZP66756.1 hypothetical protein N1030_14220 [Desulfovibrio mangrovi]